MIKHPIYIFLYLPFYMPPSFFFSFPLIYFWFIYFLIILQSSPLKHFNLTHSSGSYDHNHTLLSVYDGFSYPFPSMQNCIWCIYLSMCFMSMCVGGCVYVCLATLYYSWLFVMRRQFWKCHSDFGCHCIWMGFYVNALWDVI